MLLVALGWAVFHSHLQFTVLISENNGIQPTWFLLVLFMAIVASTLLEELEQALKTWLVSIVVSVTLVLLLVTFPIAFGMLNTQFAPLIIVGSIQPMATTLVITAPINLFGCFFGQVMRNKLI